MKLSDIVDALKEFFLDFLGYLLPGIYGLILLSYCITPFFQYGDFGIGNLKIDSTYLFLFFSYLLGYVIYSMSELTDIVIQKIGYFKNKIGLFGLNKMPFLKLKSSNQIENEIEGSFEFKQSKIALNNIWVDNSGKPILSADELDKFKARNLRNILMSYIPEADTKIYKFMFRSELCKNISCFSILFSLSGILFSLLNIFFRQMLLFKIGFKFLILYFMVLLCSLFLLKTKERFLSIAYRIPYSIFLAKYYKMKV